MRLPVWFIGECVGTFILVFFGCGSVCAAVLTSAQAGIFQVAIVWGVAVAVAIHLTASLSGAHLNPAVTIAMMAFGDFEKRKVKGYLAAQFCGAFLAAAVLHGIFATTIAHFEKRTGIVRGEPGSEASAMIYGEYFPNPGGKPLTELGDYQLGMSSAFLAEVIGTALLVFVICGLIDRRNSGKVDHLNPTLIGLTVMMLISIVAPLTQAAFNPARDLAPRVFSALAGWGSVPFTTNGVGWWWVYLVGPTGGGLLGGFLYFRVLKPAYAAKEKSERP